MGIFDTFKHKSAPRPEAAKPEHKTSLQLLFKAPFTLDSDEFTRDLRAYDPTLCAAKVSIVDGGEGSALGDVSFGGHAVQHAVQVVIFGFPMPDEPVEACLQSAHFKPEAKALARTQKAHGLLFYRGGSQNVSEQYVALGLVAGALAGYGALSVLNEAALTALPAAIFTGESGEDMLNSLRTFPPLYLFAGLSKYEIEGRPGVWMRTHGLQLWDLPNLATLVENHGRGQEIFDIFSNVIAYMISKGPILCAGHTMQIGEDIFMKLREPGETEARIGDEHELLIADFIRADQTNPFVFNV